MRKIIIGVLFSIFVTANLFAQLKTANSRVLKQEKTLVQSKVGDFSVDEIGRYHNYVLDILRTSNVDVLDTRSMSDLLKKRLPLLDKRFTDNVVNDAMKIYSSTPFLEWLKELIRTGGTGPYNPNPESPQVITNVQNQVLEHLMKDGNITQRLSDVINKTNNLDIDSFNRIVSNELKSKDLNDNERYYLSVYSSVYNASYIYWNTVTPISAIAGCKWCVHAADAVGGLVGLLGTPAASIVGAALFSIAAEIM